MLGDFEKCGVQVVAVTSNAKELAEQSTREWGLDRLRVGYGLTIQNAREWGLFVSGAVKDTEPDHFTEPGLFVVRADGTLYSSSVQTLPFARPTGAQLLSFLEFVIEKDYPARGEAG